MKLYRVEGFRVVTSDAYETHEVWASDALEAESLVKDEVYEYNCDGMDSCKTEFVVEKTIDLGEEE